MSAEVRKTQRNWYQMKNGNAPEPRFVAAVAAHPHQGDDREREQHAGEHEQARPGGWDGVVVDRVGAVGIDGVD